MKFRHVRSRIAFSIVFATLTSLLLCWFILFFYFQDRMTQQALNDSYQFTRQLAQRIDNDYEYVTEYGGTIAYNETFLKALAAFYEADGFSKYSQQRRIYRDVTDYALLAENVIYDIYIVQKDASYSLSSYGKYDDVLSEGWFQDFLAETPSQTGLTDLHKTVENSRTHVRVDAVSYIRPLVALDSSFQLLGYLVIDLSLEELFSSGASEDGITHFIIDDQGLFYPSELEKIPQLDFTEASQPAVRSADGYYYLSVYMPNLEKYIVGVVPQSEIWEAMVGSIHFMVVSLVCGICIAVAAAIILSKTITRPMLALTKGMKHAVESGFQTQLVPLGRDELAELTRLFNTMQRDICALIQKNQEIDQKERTLQLKYYMSKINPHFLYNSLNCVIYLTRRKQYEEIIPFTKSLISILRYNIAVSDARISLKEEKEYLENYFSIMKYRYPGVTLELNISSRLEEMQIQPMILYPLVENALFHGVAPSEQAGVVQVNAVETPTGKVTFTVKDNGIGISDARKREIQDYLDDNERTIYGSIGLKNVNDRLRLFYSSCTGLHISSETGKGTEVVFSIHQSELGPVFPPTSSQN